MKKKFYLVLFVVLTFSFLLVFVQPISAAPTAGTEVTASEDAYMYLSEPSIAHNANALTLESQIPFPPDPPIPFNVRVVLLKFENITMANPIVEARLNMFTTECTGFLPFSSEQVDVYAVDDDTWSEGTVTWNSFNVPENSNRGSFLLSIDAPPIVEDYNYWTDIDDGTDPLADFIEAQNLATGGDGTATLWLEISGAAANTQLSFMDTEDAGGFCGAAGGNHPILQFADSAGPLAVTLSDFGSAQSNLIILWIGLIGLLVAFVALIIYRRRAQSE